jgi:uncharacterized protein YhaN
MSAKYLEGPLRVAAIIAGVLLFIWPFISTYLSMRSFLSERQGKLDEMKKQMDSLKDQIAETEKLYSGLDLTNPKNVLNRLRELRSFQREMDLKKEALKQRPGLEEVQSKYNLLSNELVVVSKKVDDLKSQNPSLGDVEQQERIGAAIEEARAEISLLEKQLRELAQEKENLKLELARAEANEVAPEESLEEEISEMEGGLSRLKLNRDAHLLAIRVLEEAASEFRSSHLIRIEQKTSSYLGQITGTQCRVTLDEQLEPLGVEQAGRLFQISQLSQGVRDQLYFALRLAAVEEISGDTRLPLLLDDPFVNFDESRLKTTLQMLEKISQSHQVVLFTHDRRYCDWRQPSSILES